MAAILACGLAFGAGDKTKPLTLQQAIALALEKSDSFLSAELARQRAKAAADFNSGRYAPVLALSATRERRERETNIQALSSFVTVNNINTSPSISGTLPTGTVYTLSAFNNHRLTAIDQDNKEVTANDNTTAVVININQNLLRNSWWHEWSLMNAAEAQHESAEYTMQEARLTIAADAASAYLALYRATALQKVAARSEELALRLLNLTRTKIKAGLLHPLAIAQTEAVYSQRQAEVAQAVDTVVRAELNLVRVIYPESVDASDEDWWTVALSDISELDRDSTKIPKLENLLARARKEHPTLLRLIAQKQRAEALASARDANAYPDLSLFGSAATGFRTDGKEGPTGVAPGGDTSVPLNYAAGILISTPIGSDTADVNAQVAAIELRQASQALEAAKRDIETNIRRSYESLRLLSETLKARKRALKSAMEALEVEKRSFTAGRSTSFEILQAQEQAVTAERAYALAEIDREVAFVTLMAAVGEAPGEW